MSSLWEKSWHFLSQLKKDARNHHGKGRGILSDTHLQISGKWGKKLSKINHFHSHSVNQVKSQLQQHKHWELDEGRKQVKGDHKKFYPIYEIGRLQHIIAGIEDHEWVRESVEEPGVIKVNDAEYSGIGDWDSVIELKNEFSFLCMQLNIYFLKRVIWRVGLLLASLHKQ